MVVVYVEIKLLVVLLVRGDRRILVLTHRSRSEMSDERAEGSFGRVGILDDERAGVRCKSPTS